MRRHLFFAAIAFCAANCGAQPQSEHPAAVVENPSDFVRVYFESTAVRLPAEQRARLSSLVATFASMPRCPHRAWFVFAHAARSAKESEHALARDRANRVTELLVLYGVPQRELCGAASQSFFGGEDVSGKKAGLVYTEVYCGLAPAC